MSWKEWPDAVQGLAALPVSAPAEVLLLALQPDRELPELLAAVRLIRERAGSPVRVVAASPHPSGEWLGPLWDVGVDAVWWIERPGTRKPQANRVAGRPQEVRGEVCPALHSRTQDGVTLSVCGRHGDRMVLAARHLERWCLRHHVECPHWKFGPGAWCGEDDG